MLACAHKNGIACWWVAVALLLPGTVLGQAKPEERFQVPEGFRVQEIVKRPAEDKNFSLLNMCFDAKGRMLVSREDGGIFLCTEPDEHGELQKVTLYSDLVTSCQGMCWVDDALLVVGKGPKATGLHRIRENSATGQPDSAELLLPTQGGMQQHGPHAILHGPDGLLYFVTGNAAYPRMDNGNLAKTSPLTRWPTGSPGPDQGKPRSTEDVLLPFLGKTAGDGMNAPGGTIWRINLTGKNPSLVAAGFRNQYDAAFNLRGELFSFDSDMEWDLNLPWYRPVRICHVIPGADFVWRAGSANTPNYYLDSLPPLHETGPGSPVGLEFYDHHVFPEKYHGALFMGDWSIGCIWAVHLTRHGATYKAEVEKFCTGKPMNVTDLAVAPDGSLVFTCGGGSSGGVFRIVSTTAAANPRKEFLGAPQPLSAWGRAAQKEFLSKNVSRLPALAKSGESTDLRLRALDGLHRSGKIDGSLLEALTLTSDPEVAAHAIYLLGMHESQNRTEVLTQALKHADALVRRRACEALIRAGIEPEIAVIWPVLGDADHFTATAARLVVEHIDAKKWADRIAAEESDLVAENAIIALAHHHQAADRAEIIFNRLATISAKEPHELLNWLRTLELALLHTSQRPASVKAIAAKAYDLFPHANNFVNRGLATALTQFQREGLSTKPFQAKVMPLLRDPKGDREQQIYYYCCVRLLKNGWKPEERLALAEWYDRTKAWTGGANFNFSMEKMFKQCLNAYTPQDRLALIKRGDKLPWAARALLLHSESEDIGVPLADLLALHQRVKDTNVEKDGKVDLQSASFRQALDEAIGRHYLEKPTAEGWPFLVSSLRSNNPILRGGALTSLQKLNAVKPKADDAKAFRLALETTYKVSSPKEKWQTIELVRQWTGKSFGSEPTNWEPEWNNWARWFAQSFPKEPPLPNAPSQRPGESKYTLNELSTYLERDPQAKKADPIKGRMVVEKAQCLKCHKFGKEGDSVGPDLTAVAKRFNRQDVLDSILFPSKVIADQYRSTTIITTAGQAINGLATMQGDAVTVLLNDASRIMIKNSDIESQIPSLVSVMPERLLDSLTKQEIADLIAYLETNQ